SSVNIYQGGTLTLDNTAVNFVGRFTATTKPSVTLNSGTFNFLANNSPAVTSSETLGPVTLASGLSTINSGYATAPVSGVGTSTLNIPALARNTGATVNFIGGTGNITPLGSATNRILINNLTANLGATTALQYLGTGAGG